MSELTCPVCDHEFEARTWDVGECPECGNGYCWDEMCTEDYSDCWAYVEWDSYKKRLEE